MSKVAIIGLGQLGSRHLQALALLNIKIDIELVDISKSSLDLAISRFHEIPQANNFKGSIVAFDSIQQLSEEIDIVIIACSSKERRGLTEELLSTKKVKYLILEKVLFTDPKDYDIVSEIIKKYQVKVWVNCPRRMIPSFQQIKKLITPDVAMHFNVSGSNWGLGSNGVHFLDLFSFLTEGQKFDLSSDLLDNTNPVESNRKGYVDFTGTITGKSSRGDFLKITSYSTSNLPVNISIQTPFERISINEYEGSCFYYSQKNNWAGEKIDIKIPFQSQLTSILVEELLELGKCKLPTYEQSMYIHLQFINVLIDYQKIKLKQDLNICMIT